MWPVTQRFLDAVRQSHEVVTRADLFIDDNYLATIYPIDGSVSVDARRAIRRTMSLTVVDEDGTLTPGQGARTGLLTPFGTEIRLYRGVRYPDGAEEVVPLGVFVVTDVSVEENSDGTRINVNGSDRAIRIERNKFLDPYQVSTGTAVETAVASILANRWADVETDFPATGFTTTQIVVDAKGSGGDAWRTAREIADAAGYELAFDPDGVARMRTVPDPLEDEPVQTYEDGSDAVLTTISRKFDSARSPNGVVVSVEGSGVDVPIRAIAWDDNPNSVTYRFGPYGQVPFFYSNSLITTSTQAQQVALAFLRKFIGQAEAIEWNQIVNPAHDVLDVVRVRRGSLDLSVVLDRLSVPLGASGIMAATARVWEV